MKIIVAVWALSVSGLFAAAVDPSAHFDDSVAPGRTLSVAGKFDTTSSATVAIYPVGSTTKQVQLPATIPDTKTLTFKLPDDIPPGRYYATVKVGSDPDESVPGEIRVQPKVELDGTHPTTAYRDSKTKLFNFDILGDHFSKNIPEQNQIYINGFGGIIRSWKADQKTCESEAPENLPCLWVESPQRLHVVGYKAERYQGPLRLSVRVGSSQSEEKDLVLARMSETGVLTCSVAIFLVLGFIIYRLVARGIRDTLIDGKRISPFFSFFLDKESLTYSLSKFQLFLFSATFVFGYLYVFLCQWLVQWRFQLPDVPSNIAGLLAISAGTTVAAAGATSARGSKGSGEIYPSPADFISTGGLVVPERFQFFVWTLVACFGFLALLVSQNPATISAFPNFPDGLLYVMGISSAGYLGGKLVRKAGPVIRNIAWDGANNQLIVQGENLSQAADYYIDGHKLPIVPSAAHGLVTATPQSSASDPTFSTELKVTIAPAASVDLTSGDHTFRISNPDGQFADMRFTSDPPTIVSVRMTDPAAQPSPAAGVDPNKLIRAAKCEQTVSVTGSGLRAGTIARWRPPNGLDPIELPVSAVQFQDPGNLKLTLVAGDPGSGTLLLVTPNGFSATANVVVA